jgi:regulator of PEP synthase PpsR (kinase-PPPase family)
MTADPIPTMPNRSVFFVSDGTGITAETFGNSILAQFPAVPRHVRRPFIETPDKAREVLEEINQVADAEGKRPIVFITLVDDAVRQIITGPDTARTLSIPITFDEAKVIAHAFCHALESIMETREKKKTEPGKKPSSVIDSID